MPEWREDLLKRLNGKKPNDPVFPRARGWFGKGGDRVAAVSNRFHTILVRAGLAEKWTERFKDAERLAPLVGRRRNVRN